MKFNGSALEPAGAPPAPAGCRVLMAADLWGDYRDEIVCAVTVEGRMNVLVLANTAEAAARGVTRTSSREYRLWLARNMGAGYASYFEWEDGH
jgi:hypothetical protein